MIYQPREDSFLLQKHIEKFVQENSRVLDMGTGSGIQALAALKKTKNVLAVDIDDEAVAFAKNQGINSIKSDLFQNVKGKFDLIIFNPPYLPSDKRADDLAITGGKYGYEILERFFKDAKSYLTKDGKILFVFSNITGDIEFILKNLNYEFKILDQESFFFEKIYVCLARIN